MPKVMALQVLFHARVQLRELTESSMHSSFYSIESLYFYTIPSHRLSGRLIRNHFELLYLYIKQANFVRYYLRGFLTNFIIDHAAGDKSGPTVLLDLNEAVDFLICFFDREEDSMLLPHQH